MIMAAKQRQTKTPFHGCDKNDLAQLGLNMCCVTHEGRCFLQRMQVAVDELGDLVEGKPDETQFLGKLQNGIDDLSRLLAETSRFGRPLHLNVNNCNLTNVWRTAWRQICACHKNGAELQENVVTGEMVCQADRPALIQVFRNLFENSIAASPEAHILIEAKPKNVGDARLIELHVRDDGPGLNVAQRCQVFEPFFTTKSRGTGLGLSICKRIVEGHHGQISAKANDPGAHFMIRIPRSVK